MHCLNISLNLWTWISFFNRSKDGVSLLPIVCFVIFTFIPQALLQICEHQGQETAFGFQFLITAVKKRFDVMTIELPYHKSIAQISPIAVIKASGLDMYTTMTRWRLKGIYINMWFCLVERWTSVAEWLRSFSWKGTGVTSRLWGFEVCCRYGFKSHVQSFLIVFADSVYVFMPF